MNHWCAGCFEQCNQREAFPQLPNESADAHVMLMLSGDRELRWQLDYPQANQALFANARSGTGWCYHERMPIERIALSLNGKVLRGCRLGYARLDAERVGVPRSDALSAGFRFEFDPESLPVGHHILALIAEWRGGTGTIAIPVRWLGPDSPASVSDVFIDVVGYCNLRCAMCPQGNLEALKSGRAMGVMEPELYYRTLSRLADEGLLPEHVNLYNWGDPLIHPALDDLLAITGAFKRAPIVSSNLSMSKQHVRRLLRSRTHLLIVSISGMTQPVYGRNHRGGQINRVLENIVAVCENRTAVDQVLLKYLLFSYNGHEVELAREFAVKHGIQFGVYRGTVPSTESFLVTQSLPEYASTSAAFTGPTDFERVQCGTCPQESTIVVDHTGNLEVCCVAWKNAFGSSVLTADLRQYLRQKLRNPTCKACLASGYAHHKHYGVIDREVLGLTMAATAPSRPKNPE